MWFNYLVLLTALTISGVAAYYSIIGLTAIFAAAFWPIVIMGSVLEAGKLVTSVWLKKYWDQANWQLKTYLTSAVIILMLVTSMGIFGFLSKAHMDQGVPTGDITAQVNLFDEKIKTQRDNIESNRKALAQMDATVDQTIGRSTTEQGATNAANLRRSQQRERGALQNEIAVAQKAIAKLNEERAPIASQLRKVEAEVGPIKYIAALVYGDNPDQNLLEKAVRWVIIILVLVFDPLAIALILAANSSMRWVNEKPKPDDSPLTEIPPTIPELDSDVGKKPTAEELKEPPPPAEPPDLVAQANQDLGKIAAVEHDDDILTSLREAKEQEEIKTLQEQIAEQKSQITALEQALLDLEQSQLISTTPVQSDQVETIDMGLMSTPVNADFGDRFPDNPARGDMFVRTDYLPSKVFKFNGNKWMEVDKNSSDTYTSNNEYIQHLVSQLSTGEIELDQLSEAEQIEVKRLLKKEVVLGK